MEYFQLSTIYILPSIDFEGFPLWLCDIQLWNTSFELQGFSPIMSNDTKLLSGNSLTGDY